MVIAAFARFVVVNDVKLAAQNGMDALGFSRVIELDAAEQVAMIGHGNGGHPLLGGDVH